MNVTKLIEMLQAAGYDDSKAGAAAFERVNLIAFFEAYRKGIEDEAPGRADIEREVRAVLADDPWPCVRPANESDFVQFFNDVLTRLLINRFAKAKPAS